MYNKSLNDAIENYCFLNIEYDIVSSNSDLIIHPAVTMADETVLGFITSNYTINPKVNGIPKIYMSNKLSQLDYTQVLIHELGHFFGLPHSIDEESIMFEYYFHNTYTLSRQDSILLKRLYNFPQK